MRDRRELQSAMKKRAGPSITGQRKLRLFQFPTFPGVTYQTGTSCNSTSCKFRPHSMHSPGDSGGGGIINLYLKLG